MLRKYGPRLQVGARRSAAHAGRSPALPLANVCAERRRLIRRRAGLDDGGGRIFLRRRRQRGGASARAGYRSQAAHPATGAAWPPIPRALLDLWAATTGYPAPPEACLINHYDAAARMGLHQDRDEQALDAPVLSVSLGDTALFRVGGTRRGEPTRSLRLASGDLLLLEGATRMAFHGIDRLLAGSSRLLSDTSLGGGRLNLTLRRVTRPAP